MVRSHVKKLAPLECGDGIRWVTFAPGAKIRPSLSAAHGPINCSYAELSRASDFQTRVGEWRPLREGWIPRPGQDFFRIQCVAPKAKVTHRHFHAQVSPLPLKASATRGGKAPLNVYMLGIDSTSRLHFQRLLPKVYDFLRTELAAVILEAYNIVGDGTPQALTPILTGRTEEELPNVRRGDKGSQTCDVYPFLWKDFARRGYSTLWAEDGTGASTYQYRLNGFAAQPTAHYMRTFFLDSEREGYKWAGTKESKCIGPETQAKFFLRYARSHLEAYQSSGPSFTFVWHDMLSHNDFSTLQLGDQDFYQHLKGLKESGLLERTFLMVLADHGARFRGFRASFQGQMEERLPFVSFVAPAWWRQENAAAWANLQLNAHRLTTPFDLHRTLKDLLEWEQRGGTEGPSGKELRGRSLWVPVPPERTCADADIAAHWCTCIRWLPEDAASERAAQLGAKVIAAINNYTSAAGGLCRPLSLKSMESLQREAVNDEVLRYKGVLDKHGFVPDLGREKMFTPSSQRFQARLRAAPSDALFEATFEEVKGGEIRLDVASVSRLNAYGDQSHCIKAKQFTRLVRFCLCSSA